MERATTGRENATRRISSSLNFIKETYETLRGEHSRTNGKNYTQKKMPPLKEIKITLNVHKQTSKLIPKEQ